MCSFGLVRMRECSGAAFTIVRLTDFLYCVLEPEVRDNHAVTSPKSKDGHVERITV